MQHSTLSTGITGPNGTRNPRLRCGSLYRNTITPIDTSTNANSVPMFDISASEPTSNSPDGIATRIPATHVANAGVRKRGCTLLNASGSSLSRLIANQTRACPSWNTRIEEIIPMIAPISTSQPNPVQTVSTGFKRYSLQCIHYRSAVTRH